MLPTIPGYGRSSSVRRESGGHVMLAGMQIGNRAAAFARWFSQLCSALVLSTSDAFAGPRAIQSRWIRTLAAIVLAFSLGVATSRAHDRYARQVDCQRWRANVER